MKRSRPQRALAYGRSLLLGCGLACFGAATACAGPPAQSAAGGKPTTLHLAPLTDLTKAPGLVWVAHVKPREFLLSAELAVAVSQLIPEARFAREQTRWGGVGIRALQELVIAEYTDSQLVLGRGNLDPGRVEQAFARDIEPLEARVVEDEHVAPPDRIVRLFGHKRGELVHLALFGRDGFALQHGPDRIALRASIAYAEAKLSRAKPALHAAPLAEANALVGEAPLRVFFPGPFTGDTANGLGGLLKGSTAVAIRMRVVTLDPRAVPHATAAAPPQATRAGLAFTLFVFGGFGEDTDAALSRLSAAYTLFTSSGIGKLMGLDAPALAPRTRREGSALALDVTYDAEDLATGIHGALEGEISEILAR